MGRSVPWPVAVPACAKRPSAHRAGHPERFIEAFANIYQGVATGIRARLAGGVTDALEADYPRVEDGARGVRFIEKMLESSRSAQKWTTLDRGAQSAIKSW